MPDQNMSMPTLLFPKAPRKRQAQPRAALPGPKPFLEVAPPEPPPTPKLLAAGEVMGKLFGTDIWEVSGGGPDDNFPEAPVDGITYGRRDAAWNPAVARSGDVMQGQLNLLARNPLIDPEAAHKRYVDETVATADLYKGQWQVDTNTPNLSALAPADRLNGYRWVAVTTDPLVAAPCPPGMTGIAVGTPIAEGNWVIWSQDNAAWTLVRGTGLTRPIADDLYVSRDGDQMSGALLAYAYPPTVPDEFITKRYVDGLVFTEPPGSLVYGRLGEDITNANRWIAVVNRGGDQMFGELLLDAAAPTGPRSAVPREYVDTLISPVPGTGAVYGRAGPAATSSWQRAVALAGNETLLDKLRTPATIAADIATTLVTKGYVDNIRDTGATAYVKRAGDTMLGDLILDRQTIATDTALIAPTKGYVDQQDALRLTVAQGDLRYVEVAGDTMTGPLTLTPAQQSAPAHAATRGQAIMKTGDTMTGTLVLVPTLQTLPAHAAPISLVEASALLHVKRAGDTMTGTITTSRLTLSTDADGTLVSKSYIDELVIDAGNLPLGGLEGQVLTKVSDDDNDIDWMDAGAGEGLPPGGTPRQILAKTTGVDGDADWVDAEDVVDPPPGAGVWGRTDAGDWGQALPIGGGALTGTTTMTPATTTTDPANTLATKGYVDSRDLLDAPSDSGLYGRRDAGWVLAVPLGGGTMSGILTLAGDPVALLDSVPKQYVDNAFTAFDAPAAPPGLYGRVPGAWNRAVANAGDTMTGLLILSASPTAASDVLQAATKQYVDDAVVNDSYRGVWEVGANAPDLNTVVPPPAMGDRWLCVTADPAVGEECTATIPGLTGKTIYEGSFIIWDAALATPQFDLIAAGGLTKQEADGLYVALAGSTMTGFLTLSEEPTADLHAATRKFVLDNAGSFIDPTDPDTLATWGRTSAGAWQRSVALRGDTMTGPLVLPGDPVLGLEAATKDYVDRQSGDTLPPLEDIFTGYGLYGGDLNALRAMGNYRTGGATTNMPPGTAGSAYCVNLFNAYNENVMVAYEFAPQAPGSNFFAIWVRKMAITNNAWHPWVKTFPSYDQTATDQRYLQLAGGTISGFVSAAQPPTLTAHLTNKAYVDRLLTDATRYQGTWRVEANVPDLNPPAVTPVLGDRYLCLTDTAVGTPERAPAGMPGIGGQLIYAGDVIVWDTPLSRWEIIHSTGLSKVEADAFYLPFEGGELTGPLLLSRDPVEDNEAATRQFVLDSIPDMTVMGAVQKTGDTMSGHLDMIGTHSTSAYGPLLSSAVRVTATNAVGGDRVLGFQIMNPADDRYRVAAFGGAGAPGVNQHGSAFCYANDAGNGFVEVWHSNAGGLTPTLYCQGPVSAPSFPIRSSRMTKHDIVPADLDEAAAAFSALRPSRYRMNVGGDTTTLRWGMIVEEVEAAAPETVSGDGIEKAYDIAGVMAIAIAEIKRLGNEVASLKKRVIH